MPMRLTFDNSDPSSPAWRSALTRYVGAMLAPLEGDEMVLVLKEIHHSGWRAGVRSIRNGVRSPECPRTYPTMGRRAWEHGAVAGCQAAREYLEESGNAPGMLR